MRFKSKVSLALVVLLLIFLFQNTQVVSIRFLFWELSMSRIILLSLVALIGFMVGLLAGLGSKKS